ncbi:ABC transporter permease subunit [Alkalibaculum sp. M08DMB]|uniref:ABC transporter permease subunit n=1 Tax=Alkalibaculum sporogenes TaxID=2655001 RepID=A0A6A7K646_9FIRM|nr:ABC transporter permease [Alkalibaculum sporogenes]MPW24918.1 ABC transporter permease subunit [Alkalibaculum sporogenes]
MIKHIVKRFAYSLFTIFLIATITFFLMNLVPGGPFLSEKNLSPQITEVMNDKYGLNEPVIIQYKNYMIKLAQGDLGVSIINKGRDINDIIYEKFLISAKVGFITIVLAITIGIAMGVVAAISKGKLVDRLLTIFSTLGMAVPNFVIATALLIIFGVKLRILPTYGLSSSAHFILPVLTLAFYPMAYIARLLRTTMLDVLDQDYIRTARSKGLSEFQVLVKHGLRNAITPIITYLGPMIAYILTGSFVVEKIFSIPGLGGEFIGSINGRDYPMIMGTTIFLATIMVSMNFIVDILYKVIDPRIELN